MSTVTPLTGWLLHHGDRSIPAGVPGTVHTDLLAAGLIPDPLTGDREAELAWIGAADWRYSCEFTVEGESERVDLVCEGLDTVAELAVNGAPVGSAVNMHRTHRFDLRSAVREGANELSVTFRSALAHAERLRDELGDRPGAYPMPYQFIRKAACNFGWDWGPAFTTCGIWRPIGLHRWHTARLAGVRPEVTVDADGTGRVKLHVEVERTRSGGSGELVAVARIGDREQTVPLPGEQSATVVELTVEQPELWWPRGHGAQPLYGVHVELRAGAEVLDSRDERIGFRTVELDTTPDAHGTPFTFRINGEPILIRGVNWIPDDVFFPRITPERYAERLGQACDAGVNLVRVWGGGIYESESFYETADERGLLVWQDFLFACAAYPEEEPLAGEVRAEAGDAVRRLAWHPSLVLWNGNNENIWGHWDWDWRAGLGERTWGAGYYFGTLAEVVARLDPTRPYWPGSPYSGDPAVHPNHPDHGPIHIWDVWNDRDYADYRTYRPRFVAEFGYQGPPAHPTAVDGFGSLGPGSPGVLAHQKAIDGAGKLARGLAGHFGPVTGDDDWHYLTQLNQARAVRLGVEHFRSLWPRCTGTVVWQLNDCWPSMSWSAVDSAGRRKLLWYALREAHRDRQLTIQPRDTGLAVAILNDTGTHWDGRLRLERRSFTGEVLAEDSVPFGVTPRSVQLAPLPAGIAQAADPARELVVVTAGEFRALWFFDRDHSLDYPEPEFEAAAHPDGDGTVVTVHARSLLRDLCVFADRVDPAAVVDHAMRTVLPGESVTFRIHHRTGDPSAFTAHPVLRCVNDVLARTAAPG